MRKLAFLSIALLFVGSCRTPSSAESSAQQAAGIQVGRDWTQETVQKLTATRRNANRVRNTASIVAAAVSASEHSGRVTWGNLPNDIKTAVLRVNERIARTKDDLQRQLTELMRRFDPRERPTREANTLQVTYGQIDRVETEINSAILYWAEDMPKASKEFAVSLKNREGGFDFFDETEEYAIFDRKVTEGVVRIDTIISRYETWLGQDVVARHEDCGINNENCKFTPASAFLQYNPELKPCESTQRPLCAAEYSRIKTALSNWLEHPLDCNNCSEVIDANFRNDRQFTIVVTAEGELTWDRNQRQLSIPIQAARNDSRWKRRFHQIIGVGLDPPPQPTYSCRNGCRNNVGTYHDYMYCYTVYKTLRGVRTEEAKPCFGYRFNSCSASMCQWNCGRAHDRDSRCQ